MADTHAGAKINPRWLPREHVGSLGATQPKHGDSDSSTDKATCAQQI